MNCASAKEKNGCTCTYANCPRHGNCCACIAHHRDKNQMVACYFTPELEKTYDRSMENFRSQFK